MRARSDLGMTYLKEAGVLFGGKRLAAWFLPVVALALRVTWLDMARPADATLMELFFPLAAVGMAAALFQLDLQGMDETLLVGSASIHRVWYRRLALICLWLLISGLLLTPTVNSLLVLGPSVFLTGLLLSISSRVSLRAGVSAGLTWWGVSYLALSLGNPVHYFGPFSWAMLQLVETGLTPSEIWLRKGAQAAAGLLLALDWAYRCSRGLRRPV